MLVLFVSVGYCSILLYPINIVSSILDKEHEVVGISRAVSVPNPSYVNRGIKEPSLRSILPRKASPRHAANKKLLLIVINDVAFIKLAYVSVFSVGGIPVYIFFDVETIKLML